MIDPEPDPTSKRARIVSQQQIEEEIDNAPEVTAALTAKMEHLRAEQTAKIQASLQNMKNWQSVGLKPDSQMREIAATIIKVDNAALIGKVKPKDDPKRLANFSVHSPYMVRVTEILGESRVQRNCFGCHDGMGMPKTDAKITLSFEEYAIDLFMTNDWIAAAQQCEKYYKEHVQQSIDPHDPEGELPHWSARDIFDHFKDHQTHEPLRRRWKRMQMQEIMNVIYENSIFTCNAEIMKIGHRAPDINDIEIDYNAVETWMKLSAQETKLGEGDPKKFLSRNERIADDKVAPAITRKVSKGRQLKLPSLFNPECG